MRVCPLATVKNWLSQRSCKQSYEPPPTPPGEDSALARSTTSSGIMTAFFLSDYIDERGIVIII